MENLHLSVIKKLVSFVPIDGMGEIARGKYCCWIFFVVWVIKVNFYYYHYYYY